MDGIDENTLFEILDAARIEATGIAEMIETAQSRTAADFLDPVARREMRIAILPYQQFVAKKGIPHLYTDKLQTACNSFTDSWEKLIAATAEHLTDNDRRQFRLIWNKVNEAFLAVIRKQAKAGAGKKEYVTFAASLAKVIPIVAQSIEDQITLHKHGAEAFIELRDRFAAPSEDPTFPELPRGVYASKIIGECDRNNGIVQIVKVGKFYVSPGNNTAWKIIGLLLKTDDENGYALICEHNWQSSFNSQRNAAVPYNFRLTGVKSTNELFRYIHPEGRSGRFRFSTKPK